MSIVHINASADYDVIIKRGLFDNIGILAAELVHPRRAVIVSGERVFLLYGERLKASLGAAGYEVLVFIHESGEKAKSLEVYGRLHGFLCDMGISRRDALFALGGGVTGDLTGFAAATYRRGIPYFQIPTSLLAMVDSSVGGKTGINLPQAKNQIGCFYQPKAVFCDPGVLSTLPEREYRSGCGEIVKYALALDGELFSLLEGTDAFLREEEIVSRCVALKGGIVAEDEFDTGRRILLNLGHTVGHAVESCSGFTVSHGEAVAVGLAYIMRASARRGICRSSDCERVLSLLRKYGLPTECAFSASELAAVCASDKKNIGGRMMLVVPDRIGHCLITDIDINEIEGWL